MRGKNRTVMGRSRTVCGTSGTVRCRSSTDSVTILSLTVEDGEFVPDRLCRGEKKESVDFALFHRIFLTYFLLCVVHWEKYLLLTTQSLPLPPISNDGKKSISCMIQSLVLFEYNVLRK